MIGIINYAQEYANDFKKLNLEWLERYHLTESHDLQVINDPQGTIIDKGGFIFLAKDSDRIVGTGGIANAGNNIFELVKMAVDPDYRGQGIGKILMDTCLDKARTLQASKIFLYSNSQLTTAIALYEKYGFIHVDASNSPLLTADIKMELILAT